MNSRVMRSSTPDIQTFPIARLRPRGRAGPGGEPDRRRRWFAWRRDSNPSIEGDQPTGGIEKWLTGRWEKMEGVGEQGLARRLPAFVTPSCKESIGVADDEPVCMAHASVPARHTPEL
jgi:hypothetical protein